MSQSIIGRRQFLAATAAGALGWRAFAEGTPPSGFPGLITRQQSPLNLEFPMPTLDSFITPVNRFYIRGHFAIPKIDPAAYKLVIDGHVENILTLSLDDLKKMPSKTVTATAECAGNGRATLVPKPKGLLWESGAVGNAEWTGVPLAAVLEKAGMMAGAVEAILTGADEGQVGDPESPGPIHFERSLPLAKATRPEVVLAYAMNGKPLTPEHGSPVRAVVPGWYGMAWVKWLNRVSLTPKPFDGFWQTHEYSIFRREGGRITIVPVTEMVIKSAIARPAPREAIAAGAEYRVFGAAWAGPAGVAKVEFSADGGKTWADAKLLGEPVPFAWRLWEYNWGVPKEAGRHTIMSRATDGKGVVQPAEREKERRNYMINNLVPVEVEAN